MRSLPSAVRPLLAGAAAIALSGCLVGPNYKGPPTVAQDAVSAGRFVRAGQDVSAAPAADRWWTALGDAELDRLETAALAASPDLAVARARLRESRAVLRQDRANLRPNTGGSALYLRTKGAFSSLTGGAAAAEAAGGAGAGSTSTAASESASSDSTIDFYDVGFDATWEPDLFGGQRRAIEGAKAASEAARANLQDAQVSLTAEVAQAYLQLRSIQQRLELSRKTAEVQSQLLELTRQRRAGGTATELDVERLNDQLETTRANTVPLQAQLTEQLDRLAVLIARSPGALDGELAATGAIPLPPARVAVGDPAALIRRRPDIRAAERRIQQQNALIGQRTADLFPKLQLLGDIGFGSTDISGLFNAGSFTYVAAPVLQWSPLTFGRTQAKIAEARADRAAAAADYQRTVLNALQDAETALSRYGRQREDLAALLRVQASADRAARLTELRVQGGTATSLDILQAQQIQVEAQTNVVQARAQLTEDFVSLEKSLGLGWSAGG